MRRKGTLEVDEGGGGAHDFAKRTIGRPAEGARRLRAENGRLGGTQDSPRATPAAGDSGSDLAEAQTRGREKGRDC